MFRSNPFGIEGMNSFGSVPFGYSSFGNSPGSGEFGADPYALSQTTQEQWEQVPGHREWEEASTKSPGALFFELTGRTDYRRERLANRPDLLAYNSKDPNVGIDQTIKWTFSGNYISIDGVLYKEYYGPGQSLIQPASDPDPNIPTAVDSPTPIKPPPPPVPATAPPLSPAFTPTPTGSAVPGTRSGAASGISEWLYKDSLGILYNGGSRDAFKQTRSVDTGSILGNYAINTWLSLSNVAAGYLSAGVVITNTVDDFFNRHLGYGAIQTVLPMSKAMGIAVEAGPAIGYSAARLSTWWSAFSRNPRVVNSALAPIFGTLAADGAGTLPLQEFEYLGKTRVVHPDTSAFVYQQRATGSRLEAVFRVWLNNVKQRDRYADAFTNRYIVEAKEGNLGQLWNPERLNDTITQVADYLAIADTLGLRGVRYAVSTLEGVEVLELLFMELHPEALTSGFLSVWWVP